MVDIIRILEKQSGFIRLIAYLSGAGEKPLTNILKETEIPVHQLYSSVEKAKELKLLKAKIYKDKYPVRNLISLTDKGRKMAEKIKEMLEIMESD